MWILVAKKTRTEKPSRRFGWHGHSFVLGTLVLLSISACSGPRVKLPKLSPAQAGRRAVKQYDADGNGAISEDELDNCPGLKVAMVSVDSDGDGRLVAEEITDRLEAQRATGVALASINCFVQLNGKPLAGASVRFVPEEFLGEGIKVASGTTGLGGTATMSIAGQEFPGVHCGFYRVEISKLNANGKETVSAKYNSETILGQEVSLRVPEAGIATFSLMH